MTTMVELLDGILTDSRFCVFLWYFSPCSSRGIQWISTGFHFAQQEQGEKYHKNMRNLESVKMPSSNSNMVVTMTPFTFNKNQYSPLQTCSKSSFFFGFFLIFLSDHPIQAHENNLLTIFTFVLLAVAIVGLSGCATGKASPDKGAQTKCESGKCDSGKCGSGKCGSGKECTNPDCNKCGDGKKCDKKNCDKCGSGKCKAGKCKDGKCGSAKCKEGKCGDSKKCSSGGCGAGKCGS